MSPGILCPSLEEISGPDVPPSLQEHIRACATCSRTAARFEALREAVRSIPFRPAPATTVDAHAARLASLAPRPVVRWRRPAAIAAGAALAAAGLAAILLVRPPPRPAPIPERPSATAAAPATPSPAMRGAVTSRGRALYQQVVELALDGSRVEVVRLREGIIDLSVEKLRPGERFMVVTPDAEVEVRGTRFEVEAARGELRRVSVESGLVEVRRTGAGRILLGPGETWTRRAPRLAVHPLEPGPPPAAVPVPAPVPAPAAPSVAEAAYVEGWTALRSGDLDRAEQRFAAAAAEPGSPLVEEARYGQTLALYRSHSPRARGAMESFLFSHPDSAHSREVAGLLGTVLLEQGDRAGAERRLREAMDYSSPEVRERARQGLEALGR